MRPEGRRGTAQVIRVGAHLEGTFYGPETSGPWRAAVVQAASVAFDPARTLEKARDLAADAARQGAGLVVFPEAFVSAYPRGLSFGATIGSRTPEGREQYRRYWESSVDVPGPAVEELARVAARSRVHLVMGVVERDGGTLYCTVLFFAPDGSYLGKHRKLMPTASERLIWGFGDGSTLPVLDTAIGRLGAAICWENYMPLLRMALYAKGIEFYCAPTADARDTWLPTVQHIALEGRCFVLSCNQFARRRDYPADYATAFGDEPRHGAVARRELHRGAPRSGAGRASLRGRVHPHRGPRPATRSPAPSTTSTWWGTMPVPTCSASTSTRRRSGRW